MADFFQLSAGLEVLFANTSSNLPAADACIDLLYTQTDGRNEQLILSGIPIIFINAVIPTLGNLPSHFIRMNGWPGFLERSVAEVVTKTDAVKEKADNILATLGKTANWVADIPGMITPRIVCSIINEAYYAVQENISTQEEIDLAMKKGTNYPYGPFEWANLIGIRHVHDLLATLSKEQSRYKPCAALIKEAGLPVID